MLNNENAVLLVIDVQERLFRTIFEKDLLLKRLVKLIQGCRLLNTPVIVTEQNPAGLGPTLVEVKSVLGDHTTIQKSAFNCCAEDSFIRELSNHKRKQVILSCVEAHICVHQTAAALKQLGYEVHVAADCISSRSMENKELALKRLAQEGVILTGLEMALFELLKTASSAQFKAVAALIK